jgi:hypothetical protein
MYGRVWQTLTPSEIRRLSDVCGPVDAPSRDNLAPTQPRLMVIRQEKRTVVLPYPKSAEAGLP